MPRLWLPHDPARRARRRPEDERRGEPASERGGLPGSHPPLQPEGDDWRAGLPRDRSASFGWAPGIGQQAPSQGFAPGERGGGVLW